MPATFHSWTVVCDTNGLSRVTHMDCRVCMILLKSLIDEVGSLKARAVLTFEQDGKEQGKVDCPSKGEGTPGKPIPC